jgi:prepilin-type N-terminal cleavage/methylation domain-containing protein
MKPLRAKMGFSLIEILVVLGIATVLAGITVATMRSGASQQIPEFAAARVQRTLENARALAMSQGQSVFFVVASSESVPATAAYIAYALYRDGSPPQLAQAWSFLPREYFFVADPEGGAEDLGTRTDLPTLDAGAGTVEDAVSGTVRVWVVAKPDGRFYPGNESQPNPCHLVLAQGKGFLDTTGSLRFVPAPEDNAIRVRVRPLSGLTRQERILAP